MTEIENAYLNIPYDLYLFLKDNYENVIKFEFSLKFNDCKFIFYNNPTEYKTISYIADMEDLHWLRYFINNFKNLLPNNKIVESSSCDEIFKEYEKNLLACL